MEQKLITKKDIVDSIKLIEKGEYRRKFEAKEAKPVKGLEHLVKPLMRPQRGEVFKDQIDGGDIGERYAILLRDICVDEYHGNHGLTYKKGIFVLDKDIGQVIWELDPAVYRDGSPHVDGRWHLDYKVAKILEEKDDSVVIGLSSLTGMEIRKYKKGPDGFGFEIIEKYDLGTEKEDQEKLELVDDAIHKLDSRSIESLVDLQFGRRFDGAGVIELKTDKYALVRKSHYDTLGYPKRYITGADFYLVIKDRGILHVGYESPRAWLPGFEEEARVVGECKDLKLEEKDGKIEITGTLMAIEKSPGTWGKKQQDACEFKYFIDLESL